MNIKQHNNFKGVFEITLSPIQDERGFFMRTFDSKMFEENGINNKWLQENHSMSLNKGIIRGLHFQLQPHSEAKLVRCANGKIRDVFVDLRKDSDTFGKYSSIELSGENKKMILIPRGFAHGFETLSDNCDVLYKVDNFYNKENERGLLWNDPELKIKWESSEPILSEKDKKNLTLKQFLEINGPITA